MKTFWLVVAQLVVGFCIASAITLVLIVVRHELCELAARRARRRSSWRLDAPPYEQLHLVPTQQTSATSRPRMAAVPRQRRRVRS